MAPFLTLLALAAILILPPASVVAVLVWATRLRRRGDAPAFAVWTGYALGGLAALAIVTGVVGAVRGGSAAPAGDDGDVSQKARALAEGISEVMNCGALGFLIALVGAGWLGLWSWMVRRKSR